jgi:hypothetical protein
VRLVAITADYASRADKEVNRTMVVRSCSR